MSEHYLPRDEAQSGGHDEAGPPRKELLWPHAVNLFLGMWLLAGPSALDYRSTALAWSDGISGTLLVILAAVSLSPGRRAPLLGVAAPWAVCCVGVWLLLAPLVFWAPTAASYAGDTLVGALAILFAVIVPGAPVPRGRPVELPGPDLPPGWSYNPSTWVQRTPIITLALVSFFLSRHLAAYQLGHIPSPWEPFFGSGTVQVLDSEISRAWPVSDAGLGAISYLIEALSGCVGDQRRWRTMPWMVILFGILVVPLGVVSIVLVMLQPLSVGAWCTVCLATAVLMLIMIAPSVDEVIATCQFLQQSRRAGKPVWRTFWQGGSLEGAAEPAPHATWEEMLAATGLTSVPWNLILCAVLGIWLMAAPEVLGSRGAAAMSDQLVGPLVVTFAVIAFGEVTRPVRYLNLPLALWMIGSGFPLVMLLPGASAASQWNDLLVGVVLIGLTLRPGTVRESYGSWNRFILWPASQVRTPRRQRGASLR